VHRDHRKVLLVDGRYGAAGGICIADQWLDRAEQTGLPYRDTAVRVEGPAVADLERAFARVWDRSGPPLPSCERPAADQVPAIGDQAVRVIIQEPGKQRILRAFDLLMASLERRIWIADAYFLTVPRLTQALTAAASDGVDVRLLLPATNDLPIVGALSRASYRPFLHAGVRIWEYNGLMMHAKTTVADGWWGRVGSTNLNITGLWTNWELDVVVEDEGFAAAMEAVFEADLADAREIRLDSSTHPARVRPENPRRAQDRPAYQHSSDGSSRALAAVTRAGVGAFQSSGLRLSRYERRAQLVLGGGLLGFGLLAARFPRLVAWPLATIGGGFGASLLQRAIHMPGMDQDPMDERPADEDRVDR
jgi:cardiolipin synthase